MSKILVTGATGHLGKAVVNILADKVTADIAALVRDPAKAGDVQEKGVEIRQGDYDDYTSLVNAFEGIEKLYFVSGSDIMRRAGQHENVVNAAVEAGVRHVVYTSFQRKNETGDSPIALIVNVHVKTEQMLRESGLVYTILKHAVYADGLPTLLGKVLETGVIYQPAGDGKTSYTLRADMAEAGAVILTTPGHENKTYEISVNTSYSYADIANILTSVTGKTIRYVSPVPEEFRTTMLNAGVPKEYIGVMVGFSEAIRQGEFDIPDPTLEMLLGRKPVTLAEYLNSVYGKK